MKKITALLLAMSLPMSVLAAKQVIILNVSDAGANNININYLCWLTTSNPIARPNFQSAWQASGPSTGPQPAETQALQTGTTIERQFSLTVSSQTPIATIESAVINRCQGEQAYLNGIPGPSIWYGFHWDGSGGWTQQ